MKLHDITEFVSPSTTSDTTADLIPITKTSCGTTTAETATETATGTTDIVTATASEGVATAKSSSRPGAAAEKKINSFTPLNLHCQISIRVCCPYNYRLIRTA